MYQPKPLQTVMMYEFSYEAHLWPEGWRAERYDQFEGLLGSAEYFPILASLKEALTAGSHQWAKTG